MALEVLHDSLALARVASTSLLHPLHEDVLLDHVCIRLVSELFSLVRHLQALRDDSIRTAKRARSEGVDVHLDVVEFMPHIFPIFGSFLPEGAAATSRICDFITKHCHGVESTVSTMTTNNGQTTSWRLRSRM